MGLSRSEMMNYYFDELLAMMDEYGNIHNYDKDKVTEVYADDMEE